MSQPIQLVSVVIVTKDRLPLLKRAVESVIIQGYDKIEIIVVDNQSENPPNFEGTFTTDIPIRVIRTPQFLTASASRNLGVSQANGSHICFLDDDDYYLDDKIQSLAEALDNDLTADMAYGNTQMLGVDNVDLGVCNGPPEILTLMQYRYIHLNAVMIKKDLLLRYMFDEKMTTYEDADVMFRIVLNCKCLHVDKLVAVWNRDNRPDQLTSKNWKRAEKNWLILCQKFSKTIQLHQQTAKTYYKKMCYLSFYNLHFVQALSYLTKYVFYGFIQPSQSKIVI